MVGNAHDLAILEEKLAVLRTDSDSLKKPLVKIDRLMSIKRTELRYDSLEIGKRIYSQRPREMAGRIESWWNLWKKEGVDL